VREIGQQDASDSRLKTEEPVCIDDGKGIPEEVE
jgi:hypothetical protein